MAAASWPGAFASANVIAGRSSGSSPAFLSASHAASPCSWDTAVRTCGDSKSGPIPSTLTPAPARMSSTRRMFSPVCPGDVLIC